MRLKSSSFGGQSFKFQQNVIGIINLMANFISSENKSRSCACLLCLLCGIIPKAKLKPQRDDLWVQDIVFGARWEQKLSLQKNHKN